MNTQTINAFKLEWTGVLSILKTAGYTTAGAIITMTFASIYHYNFGGYEALAMILLPTIFKTIEKWLLPYNIFVTDPTVGTNDTTSPTV